MRKLAIGDIHGCNKTFQALNLDAGYVFGMGNLVAADLTNYKLYIQPKEDDDYVY